MRPPIRALFPLAAILLLLPLASACARTLPDWPDASVAQPGENDAGTTVEKPAVTTCVYIGGLDRIGVQLSWTTHPRCIELVFVNPAYRTQFPKFDCPKDWALEAGSDTGAACARSGGGTTYALRDASGTLTFQSTDRGGMPTVIAIDGNFTFGDGTTLRSQDVTVDDVPIDTHTQCR